MYDLELVIQLGVALAIPLASFIFGLWRWDVARTERRHRRDLERQQHDHERSRQEAAAAASQRHHEAEERAKEREHELRLARITSEKAHQGEVRTLKDQIIHLQQVVEDRLFTALDDSRAVKSSLTDAVQNHMLLIREANDRELAAIQALSNDVAGIKQALPGQYQDILAQLGEVLDQSRGVHTRLGTLVSHVASYHESVEQALARDGCDSQPPSSPHEPPGESPADESPANASSDRMPSHDGPSIQETSS